MPMEGGMTTDVAKKKNSEDPDFVTVLAFIGLYKISRSQNRLNFPELNTAVRYYLFRNQFLLFFELYSLWVPPTMGAHRQNCL